MTIWVWKTDTVAGEEAELLENVRRARVPEQEATHHRIGAVHRYVQRREPVLDDSLDVPRLQVGEGREVAVLERETVVIVADVQGLAQSLGEAVHEAEIAAVGTAADARPLKGNAHWYFEGALQVEFDLLSVRLADVEQEFLLGGEEFPVEKVVEGAPIDGDELGPREETELISHRPGMDGGHADHGMGLTAWRRLSSSCDSATIRRRPPP